MLQKSQSKSIAKFKYLLLIPVITGILTYTSCTDSDTVDEEKSTAISKNQSLENYKKINSNNQPLCLNETAKYDISIDNYLKLENGKNYDVIANIVSIETEEIIRTAIIYKSQSLFIRHIPEDVYRVDLIWGEEYAESEANGSCIGAFTKETLRETGVDRLEFSVIHTEKGKNVASYNLSIDLLPEHDHTPEDIDPSAANNDSDKNIETENEQKNNTTQEEAEVPIATDTIYTNGISKEKAEPSCANQGSHRYNHELDNYLRMEIENSADVIVDIISLETSEIVRTIYVPKNTTYYIRNIPEGKYYLQIMYGEGYQETSVNGACTLSFKNIMKKEKEKDILDFYTTQSSEGFSVPSYKLFLDYH